MPEITDLEIKYIQNGGYTKEHSNKKIEEDLKIHTLKNVLDCHCNFSNIIDTYSNKYWDCVYQE